MRIGLDLDGVYYKWDDTATFLIEEYFGIKIGESTHWNFIPDELKKIDRKDIWDWLWKDGVTKYGLFRFGNLYKGSREAIRRISEKGHDIVVITTRPREAIKDTIDWLAFQGIPASEVHILPFGVPKSGIPCHVYIDDGPHNVEDLLKNQPNAIMALWDRPWNQEISDPRVVRVHSWREFETLIDKIGQP